MRDFFHFDFSLRVSRIAMYYYTLSVVLLFDILDTQKVIWLCGQNVFKKFSAGEPDSIFDISENAAKGYFQFPFHILTLSSVPELAGMAGALMVATVFKSQLIDYTFTSFFEQAIEDL